MHFYSSGKKGITVMEGIISLVLLSMLMGVIFYIFSTSAKSWLKVRSSIEVRQSGQVTLTRIEKHLRTSAYNSVYIITYPSATTNEAISFLSAYDETTGFTSYDFNSGRITWKKFIIFYLEDDTSAGYYKLFSKEVNLGDYIDNFATAILDTLPYPPLTSSTAGMSISSYIGTSGTYKSQSDKGNYISPARLVVRNITSLTFNNGISGRIDIEVHTGKPKSQEKMILKSSVSLRNY
jgi:hypothetical protein